jgi:hypothetical protein
VTFWTNDMVNFEQIDDYLSNRLQEQDKRAFEQQLEGDPSLKEEVAFQRQVIEGVRQARMVQLKTMLNNVAVPAGSTWGGAKIAAAVVTAGIISTIIYLNTNEDKSAVTDIKKDSTEEVASTAPANESDDKIIAGSDENKQEGAQTADSSASKEEKKIKKDEVRVTTPVRKPDINVVDPSSELSEDDKNAQSSVSRSGRSEISPSKMEVITGIVDKKHNFHYQFSEGKLMLYGPFDKSLYEILEIHGDGHAVFLFYKENYYLLDESQARITQLQAIRDGELLKRLREYRGR